MTTTLPDGTDTDPRTAFLDGLHQIAEWLAEHPEVPKPYHLLGPDLYIYLHGDSRAVLATIARAMGNADKRIEGNDFLLSRRFAGITLHAHAKRDDVCERVVIGSHEEEVEEPDAEAVAALPKVKRTVLVEDVKWICPPLLADVEAVARHRPGSRDADPGLYRVSWLQGDRFHVTGPLTWDKADAEFWSSLFHPSRLGPRFWLEQDWQAEREVTA